MFDTNKVVDNMDSDIEMDTQMTESSEKLNIYTKEVENASAKHLGENVNPVLDYMSESCLEGKRHTTKLAF